MPDDKKFFQTNFDLYPTSKDVDVSFYQELYKFKSVQDYIDSKKRKNSKKSKSKKRKIAFKLISQGSDVNFIDFSDDVNGFSFSPGVDGANQIGGLTDHITLPEDFEGKDRYTNLNYAVQNDYSNDNFLNLESEIDDEIYSVTSNPNGSSDGVQNLDSEQGSNYNSSGYDPDYGYNITEVGNVIYPINVPI